MDFNFIEPKGKRSAKVNWKISERTRAIVQYYAEFTEHSQEEVVDEFLTNMLNDKRCREWIANKRYNKRIINQIFTEEQLEKLDIVN